MSHHPQAADLMAERNALAAASARLTLFRASEEFEKLPETERALLAAQHSVMTAYREIIDTRLATYPAPTETAA